MLDGLPLLDARLPSPRPLLFLAAALLAAAATLAPLAVAHFDCDESDAPPAVELTL
jgi:hypothetical protein